MSAGWIVSGAADPAVCRNDQGRNVCADGIGDIAAGKAVADPDSISGAIAIAIAVIVTPAFETEAATVTAKENAVAAPAAVECGEAAAMKAAAVEAATAMKAAVEAVSSVSGAS